MRSYPRRKHHRQRFVEGAEVLLQLAAGPLDVDEVAVLVVLGYVWLGTSSSEGDIVDYGLDS
jgi:hypothetical protein